MANPDHVSILEKGVDEWNRWRRKKGVRPALSGADLSGQVLCGASLARARLSKASLVGADLSRANLEAAALHGTDLRDASLRSANLVESTLRYANFVGADLTEADLRWATLRGADLREAKLCRANLSGARIREADLTGADLEQAQLVGANLGGANLRSANLRGADLSRAIAVETCLDEADLSGCRVFGISAWSLSLRNADQTDLIVTPEDQPTITVDNLQLAQFVYLLLQADGIRNIIDTVTSKVVLLLGRFADRKKTVLDAMRDALRGRDYLPILFDFEKPSSRDLTETISTLAHMARFVIADITDPRSIPQELARIVPELPSVPVQPTLCASGRGYAMFEHFRRYPWVLEIYVYEDAQELLDQLNVKVIEPAEAKAKELRSTPHSPPLG